MSRRRRGIMSEEFKFELAKDLGFYDTVIREGWEGIRTKDAGNMVKRAIQIAEEKLAQDYQRQRGGMGASVYGSQPIGTTGYAQQPPQNYGMGAGGSYRPGYAAAQPGGGYGQAAYPASPQPSPQPAPTYAYSRQSGFTPLYPSYYGYMQGNAPDNQQPNYVN